MRTGAYSMGPVDRSTWCHVDQQVVPSSARTRGCMVHKAIYGMLRHMPAATLIFRTRDAHAGGIIEIVIWSVPRPVPPSEHGFKYRLVFVRDGQRVVGYDNERGKGDHRHLGDTEKPYRFKDVPKLLEDFMRDVEASK